MKVKELEDELKNVKNIKKKFKEKIESSEEVQEIIKKEIVEKDKQISDLNNKLKELEKKCNYLININNFHIIK